MCNNHIALSEFTSVRLQKSQLCKNDLAWTNAFIELRIWGPCAQQPVCYKTFDQMRKCIVLIVKMNMMVTDCQPTLAGLASSSFLWTGIGLAFLLKFAYLKKKTEKWWSLNIGILDFLQHAYLKFYLLPCYFSACSNFQLSSGDLGALYPGHI